MTNVIFGNHCAMRVPRAQRDRIRRFYQDVLGCEVMREGDQKDDFRLGGDFYIAFLYEDEGVLEEDGFLRSTYLELKAGDAEELRRKIVSSGVTVLDVPDPHLYFQAPGGQVFRLVGVGEDLSRYEGTEHGEQFVGQQFGTRSLAEGGFLAQPLHRARSRGGAWRFQVTGRSSSQPRAKRTRSAAVDHKPAAAGTTSRSSRAAPAPPRPLPAGTGSR